MKPLSARFTGGSSTSGAGTPPAVHSYIHQQAITIFRLQSTIYATTDKAYQHQLASSLQWDNPSLGQDVRAARDASNFFFHTASTFVSEHCLQLVLHCDKIVIISDRCETMMRNVRSSRYITTCNPPCRSVLTVELSSEARLYRYLTCGGNSSKKLFDKRFENGETIKQDNVDINNDQVNFPTSEEAYNRVVV